MNLVWKSKHEWHTVVGNLKKGCINMKYGKNDQFPKTEIPYLSILIG